MTTKDPAAVALGRRGGEATARNRTQEERSAAARKAVEARWAKADLKLKQIEHDLDVLETKQRRAKQKKKSQ